MGVHLSSRFPARLNIDEFATVNRRGLLRALGAAALLTSTGGFFARSLWGNPVFATYPFPLGVASGDPSTDGFVIWTKIAPKPLERGGGMPKKAVEGEWVVAADPQMGKLGRSGKAVAPPQLGASVHVEVGSPRPAGEDSQPVTVVRERRE